jgi:type VII secretion effector (TIGR04197 family)
MAFVIQLNQAGFQMKVNAMETAGKEITTKADKPDLTGEMPTLEKYIETYEKLQKVMKSYQELIVEDATRLKGAQTALTFAESQIIK